MIPRDELLIFVDFIEKHTGMKCKINVIPQCEGEKSTHSKIPDLEYVIEGVKYFLPRESFTLCFGNRCSFKIMSHRVIKLWLLGLNFFENYYTVFDQEEMRIGFAPSIHA